MIKGRPIRSAWVQLPGVHVQQRGSHLAVAGDMDKPFPAKVVQSYTDGDGKTFYGWIEIVPTDDGEYHSSELDQPDSAIFRSGVAINDTEIISPAFNLNNTPVELDTVVTMHRGAIKANGQQQYYFTFGEGGTRNIRVLNDADEEIPGYALLRVTGWDSLENAFTVQKPNQDNQAGLLIARKKPIPPDEVGYASMDWPLQCLYDGEDSSPSVGENWGAKSGEWKLFPEMDGFRTWSTGIADPDRVWVIPTFVVHTVCDEGDLIVRSY